MLPIGLHRPRGPFRERLADAPIAAPSQLVEGRIHCADLQPLRDLLKLLAPCRQIFNDSLGLLLSALDETLEVLHQLVLLALEGRLELRQLLLVLRLRGVPVVLQLLDQLGLLVDSNNGLWRVLLMIAQGAVGEGDTSTIRRWGGRGSGSRREELFFNITAAPRGSVSGKIHSFC